MGAASAGAGYWRHFRVERRLLALGEPDFRVALMRRAAGVKAEPAFAAALGLAGNPYCALLELQDESDERLAARLLVAGFTPRGV